MAKHAANAAAAAAEAACATAPRIQAMACPDVVMETIDEGWSAVESDDIQPTWSYKTRQDWYMARHRHVWKAQADWSPPTTTASL